MNNIIVNNIILVIISLKHLLWPLSTYFRLPTPAALIESESGIAFVDLDHGFERSTDYLSFYSTVGWSDHDRSVWGMFVDLSGYNTFLI